MLAKRMQRLGTETAFEVLARARALEAQGRDVVHLEIGEPDFDTPANIIDKAVEALRSGYTHYGPSAGLPEVRKVFAEYIARDRGIDVGPDNVVIVPGGKPIITFPLTALVDPGDEVIYPNPGFPIYESVINFLGGVAVPLKLAEDQDFSFDIEDLKALITPKTKLLIINSPANPTGGVLTAADLDAIAELAVKHDFWVLSDEIYSRIIYEGRHESITTRPGMLERTIILDGHSKTYAMTGWRLGYGIMPKELAAAVAKLQTNVTSCTASFIQIAGAEALTGPQDAATAMVAEFKTRRDLLVDGLNAIEGVSCRRPRGAFYVFPNITGLGLTSKQVEGRLLDDYGVAALSGTSFGRFGEGYIRFSYANSQANIRKALERFAEFAAAVRRG
ncbi:MAG TPA: pyridoxal phosphate-dependent aminotransferase [Candidatus Krumholzibacteria bacterium]|nr:pyridoxal phosphate-dependent aminotransferase [Candidatus Krumholzibacteria bacterium]